MKSSCIVSLHFFEAHASRRGEGSETNTMQRSANSSLSKVPLPSRSAASNSLEQNRKNRQIVNCMLSTTTILKPADIETLNAGVHMPGNHIPCGWKDGCLAIDL